MFHFRTLLAVLCGLFLTSCQVASVQPALDAATLVQQLYQHDMDGHEALVRRSNPPQATLDAYLQQTALSRAAFAKAHGALMQAIGSMGGMDPAQVEAATAAVVQVIQAAKGK